MAVPKRKQSKSRTDKRFANYKATAATLVECPHCHELKVAHRVGAKLEAQNDRLEKLNEQAEELRLSAEAQARVQAANQAMTNALLEKIERSSTDLAEDIDKQMKLVYDIPV